MGRAQGCTPESFRRIAALEDACGEGGRGRHLMHPGEAVAGPRGVDGRC